MGVVVQYKRKRTEEKKRSTCLVHAYLLLMAPLARFSCLLAVLSLAFTLCSSVPLTLKNGNSLELLKTRLSANGSPAASLTCSACKIVVNVLQDLFARDASEEEIEKIIIRVCIDLKIEDENVCTLIVPTFQVSTLYFYLHSSTSSNTLSSAHRHSSPASSPLSLIVSPFISPLPPPPPTNTAETSREVLDPHLETCMHQQHT